PLPVVVVVLRRVQPGRQAARLLLGRRFRRRRRTWGRDGGLGRRRRAARTSRPDRQESDKHERRRPRTKGGPHRDAGEQPRLVTVPTHGSILRGTIPFGNADGCRLRLRGPSPATGRTPRRYTYPGVPSSQP